MLTELPWHREGLSKGQWLPTHKFMPHLSLYLVHSLGYWTHWCPYLELPSLGFWDSFFCHFSANCFSVSFSDSSSAHSHVCAPLRVLILTCSLWTLCLIMPPCSYGLMSIIRTLWLSGLSFCTVPCCPLLPSPCAQWMGHTVELCLLPGDGNLICSEVTTSGELDSLGRATFFPSVGQDLCTTFWWQKLC